jgi:hypothetical protein
MNEVMRVTGVAVKIIDRSKAHSSFVLRSSVPLLRGSEMVIADSSHIASGRMATIKQQTFYAQCCPPLEFNPHRDCLVIAGGE